MKFEDSGLPPKPAFQQAFAIGLSVYGQMMQGDMDKANAAYKATVLNVVDTLKNNCPDASDALMTVALLGPLGTQVVTQRENDFRQVFGNDVVDLAVEVLNDKGATPEAMQQSSLDKNRLFMASMVAHMDTLIIPGMKQNMLDKNSVSAFTNVVKNVYQGAKGSTPALDTLFEDRLKQVEDLLNKPSPNIKPPSPKGPKF